MGNKMIRRNLYKKGRVFFLAGVLMGAAAFSGCQNTKEPATEKPAATEEKTTAENKTTEEKTTENTTEDKGEMTEVDYNAVYQEIIDEIQEVVDFGYDSNRDYKYITPGIMEKVTYGMNDSLGYIIEDVNGDDVPELLIGYNESNGGEKIHSYIINCYTANGTKTKLLLDGWVRAGYRWLGDGQFYYLGSEGVSVLCLGECHIDGYETGAVWDDFYFSFVDNGNEAYYHNTTGDVIVEGSEKLDVSGEDYDNIMSGYENRCKTLVWKEIGEPRGFGAGAYEEEMHGQWLFLNGASLYIYGDRSWELKDDMDQWICEGLWESTLEEDGPHITLKKSADGGTDYTEVAEGLLYYNSDNYSVLQMKFIPDFTDFTSGIVELSKKAE